MLTLTKISETSTTISERSLARRLLAHIDFSDECWRWNGTLVNGYGRIYWRGNVRLAHRAVYHLVVGEIPDGYVVHHDCRNRACVNPDHLRAVPPGEHEDQAGVINARKQYCKNGHPFSSENTRIETRTNGRTKRVCKICYNEWKREWRSKRRAYANQTV